jgi:hypothetical protein
MSASFAFEKGAAVGPYLIGAQDIPYTFCKCDAGFISRGLRLEDPTTEKIQCEDKDIQLFQGVMQKKTMDALHAGDTHGVYQEMERPYRANQHTLLDLAKMYVKDNETIEEKITYYASEYKKYALSGDKGAEEEFFKKLQNEKRKKDIRDELSRRIATFGEPADPAKVKWAVFENDIRQRILATPTSKWLIFNDNATAVYDAVERLRAAGIKCTTLDGGNATAIQRAIDSYKGEDAQVLLLNSKLEAVGMNLENTTPPFHARDSAAVCRADRGSCSALWAARAPAHHRAFQPWRGSYGIWRSLRDISPQCGHIHAVPGLNRLY